MNITHYQILGIKEDSTSEEIKDAYRKKVMLFHPDVNNHPEAGKVFISIQKSYEILGDIEKRKQYDSFLRLTRISVESQASSKSTYTQQTPNNKGRTSDTAKASKQKTFSRVEYLYVFFAFFILALPVFVLAIVMCTSDNPETNKPNTSLTTPLPDSIAAVESSSVVEEVSTYGEILNYIRPDNGSSPYNAHYASKFRKKSLGEITIENGTTDDALVLIYEMVTGTIIRNVYIRSNNSVTLKKMPEGCYRMKTFYGSDWALNLNNGHSAPTGGFTKECSFSDMESGKMFDMTWEKTSTGIIYPTYTVTLHKVINGNLHTKEINKEDFFNIKK